MASREPRSPLRRALFIVLAIVAATVVYSFAVDQTDVDLDEVQSESRRSQLFLILRALARPDLVDQDLEEVIITTDIYVPCPAGGPIPEPTETAVLTAPACAEPGTEVEVTGTGFGPGTAGDITFIPESDFDIFLTVGEFDADDNGEFTSTIEVPDRVSDTPRPLQAITRLPIGTWTNRELVWTDLNLNERVDPGEERLSPRLSDAVSITWEKIIETVMLSLIATTVGTILAVPLSFMAARNLMRDISTTVTNLAMTLLSIPVGLFAGVLVARLARGAVEDVDNWIIVIALLAAIPYAIRQALRWAIPEEDTEPVTPAVRTQRVGVFVAVAVAGVVWLYVLANAAQRLGRDLEEPLGALGFLGNFLAVLGEALNLILPVLAALAGMGALMNVAGRLGYILRSRLPAGALRGLNYLLLAAGGAVVAIGIGAVIAWLYEIDNQTVTVVGPAVTGAVVGLYLAFRSRNIGSIGTGLTVYYIARTIFNTLRSVEPLIMVIVFVVWVGIGPFAGSLALALHTTAALAKLYSEQVENISEGPLEAVRATGATRLQTVVYAVAPQIVPPYISFTMYRWDINVRMSTIIGFAGGGGIGFVLQQNINLVQYRAAAVQMLAIAIVVATMDYISSRLRERFV